MSAGKMQAAAFNMFVLALPLITPIIFRCVLDFRSDLDWGVLNSFVSGFLITVFMLGLAIWRVCYREYMSAIVCILLVVSFWCLLLPERGTRDLTSQLYYYLNREPISRYTAVAVASGEELSRFEISSFGVGGYNFSRYVLIKRSGLLPSQLTAAPLDDIPHDAVSHGENIWQSGNLEIQVGPGVYMEFAGC
jgi:hypothetical protein